MTAWDFYLQIILPLGIAYIITEGLRVWLDSRRAKREERKRRETNTA